MEKFLETVLVLLVIIGLVFLGGRAWYNDAVARRNAARAEVEVAKGERAILEAWADFISAGAEAIRSDTETSENSYAFFRNVSAVLLFVLVIDKLDIRKQTIVVPPVVEEDGDA